MGDDPVLRKLFMPGERPKKPSGIVALRVQKDRGYRFPAASLVRISAIKAQERLMDAAGAFVAAAAHERDAGTLFNLAPVAFGCGILAYFTIGQEPLAAVVAASAAGLFLIAGRLMHHGLLHAVLMAFAIFAAGMGAAQLRTHRVSSPVIAEAITAKLSGLVVGADRSRSGAARYLIAPFHIEGVAADRLPGFIRVSSARAKGSFRPGDRIEGLARLQPVLGPAYPGAYDFRFFALYDRLGGSGYFLGKPAKVDGASSEKSSGLAAKGAIYINRLRDAIGGRVRAAVGGDSGEIAVALINGDHSGISQAAQNSLRLSGLAHILSISGIHMALVALTVIGTLRWVLAWFPAIVLHYPVRKWAAGAALGASTVYLVLSGGEVATQRSWLMIAVMLAATLADRRALSMRNVAIAAFLILILSPESLLEPGFQMSFAATAALVAAFSAWAEHRDGRKESSPHPVLARRLLTGAFGHFSGMAMTSLVAGTASGLFAVWHFHQFALWGFAGNILAMPVVSVAVMPLALISCLAMPYGFEAPFLAALGWSIDWVMAISNLVAGFPAGPPAGASSSFVLMAGSAGLILLTFMRTRLRFIGIALILTGLPFIGAVGTPDILIAEDGRTLAVKDNAGRLTSLHPRKNAFVTGIWLNAFSRGKEGDRQETVESCNKDLCVLRLQGGLKSWLVYDPALLPKACAQADILLAPRLRWVNCRSRQPKLVLKRPDFERGGSHAIRIVGTDTKAGASPITIGGDRKTSGVVIEVTAARRQPARPWEILFARPAETPDTASKFVRGPQTRRQPRPDDPQ